VGATGLKMLTALTCVVAIACTGMPQASCELTDAQRSIALGSIAAAIESLSDESSSYDVKRVLTSEGHLRPVRGQIRGRNEGCWAYLYPISLNSSDILDGEGALILDPGTWAVIGDPVWFTY